MIVHALPCEVRKVIFHLVYSQITELLKFSKGIIDDIYNILIVTALPQRIDTFCDFGCLDIDKLLDGESMI